MKLKKGGRRGGGRYIKRSYRQCKLELSKLRDPISETKTVKSVPSELPDTLNMFLDTPEKWILYLTKSCQIPN